MSPVTIVMVGAAVGLVAEHRPGALVSRWHRRRRSSDDAGNDVLVLAELTALGLSAGLTAGQALEAARSFVDEALSGEIAEVLRNATHGGLAAALADAPGRARRLCLILSRAVATGAPLVAGVEGFVAEQRAEARAAQLEEARRLPVRLMVPLALLVLPGFVLLTVGPTVLAALDRLALPL